MRAMPRSFSGAHARLLSRTGCRKHVSSAGETTLGEFEDIVHAGELYCGQMLLVCEKNLEAFILPPQFGDKQCVPAFRKRVINEGDAAPMRGVEGQIPELLDNVPCLRAILEILARHPVVAESGGAGVVEECGGQDRDQRRAFRKPCKDPLA